MRNNFAFFAVVSLVAFVATLVYSVINGAVVLTSADLIDLLQGRSSETVSALFLQIRLPRIIAAFAVGASLALAGTIMQSVFSNPLVEPYTLGLSGAASLGMAIAFLCKLPSLWGAWIIPVTAFIGAVPILIFLLSLGRSNRFGMKTVLLSGVMISYVCSSLVTLILTIADLETMGNIVQWGFGSLGGTSLDGALFLFFISVAVMVIVFFKSLYLNVLSLGENDSRSVGVSPEKWRILFLISATILTAGAVSVGGVIGFVGLLVPHVLRIVVTQDNRFLVPFSWFCGGTLLLVADTFGRTAILPRELPVGVIMGIVGGIVFFALLQKKSIRL